MDKADVALLLSALSCLASVAIATASWKGFARKRPALKVRVEELKPGAAGGSGLELQVTLYNDGETSAQVKSADLVLASCFIWLMAGSARPPAGLPHRSAPDTAKPAAVQRVSLEEAQEEPFAVTVEEFGGVTPTFRVRDCIRRVVADLSTYRPPSYVDRRVVDLALMMRVEVTLTNGRKVSSKWSRVTPELTSCSCPECSGHGIQISFDDLLN